MNPPPAVRVEIRPPLAWVLLDRAEDGNPVDEALVKALEAAWAQLASDERVSAVGVGASGPAFSVGALPGAATAFRVVGPKSGGCSKPVLVEVAGDVGAAAFALFAEADVVVAADDVHFTAPLDAAERLDVLQLGARVPMNEVVRLALLGPNAPLTAPRGPTWPCRRDRSPLRVAATGR